MWLWCFDSVTSFQRLIYIQHIDMGRRAQFGMMCFRSVSNVSQCYWITMEISHWGPIVTSSLHDNCAFELASGYPSSTNQCGGHWLRIAWGSFLGKVEKQCMWLATCFWTRNEVIQTSMICVVINRTHYILIQLLDLDHQFMVGFLVVGMDQ